MRSVFTSILFIGYVLSFAQDASFKQISSTQEIDGLIHGYQFSKALLLLTHEEDSLSTEVLQRKGYCLFQMGNYRDAIDQYKKVMTVDSMNTHVLYQLGLVYGRDKQYDEAYGCFERLIAMDSSNSFYYKQYGIVASHANDPIISLENFFRAIALNPRDIEAHVLLGDMLLEADQFQMADSILTQALKINPSPQLRLLLAKAQLGEEKYEAVVNTTEQLMVAKNDTLPSYARLLGISYFQLDQFNKVIPYMNHLLKNNLKADWIYYYMGVSYRQLNKADSAIIYLNKAIEAGISENISTYYTQLANSYEDIKDFKSAIKYYKAAYENSRKDILLYHLARNYDVYYKDKTTAITYFKKYLNSEDTIKLAKEYTKSRLKALDVY